MRMIPADGCMEIYATGGTFQVRTPDNVDPERRHAAIPWPQACASGAGTTNPIVARLMIQTHDCLESLALQRGDKHRILASMRTAKDEVLNCEAAYAALRREFATVEHIPQVGNVRRSGSSIETPQVGELERHATQFITSAKRALQATGEIYNEFYQPPRGGLMRNGNLTYAIAHLAAQSPPNDNYVQFLQENEPTVKGLIDLRNGQEHADDNSRTMIDNIRLGPDGFVAPMWHRRPNPPTAILPEMAAAWPFLVDFIESNFFFGLQDNAESTGIAQRLEQIPETPRDPDCPVTYRLVYERGASGAST